MKGQTIKASELITFLQEVIEKRGDAQVCVRDNSQGAPAEELYLVLNTDGDTGQLRSIVLQCEAPTVMQG